MVEIQAETEQPKRQKDVDMHIVCVIYSSETGMEERDSIKPRKCNRLTLRPNLPYHLADLGEDEIFVFSCDFQK